MSKETCQQIEEALVLAASGEPIPEQVLRHVDTCPDCRQELKRLQSIVNALQTATASAQVARPADFHARLMSRLRTESSGRGTTRLPARFEILSRLASLRWVWGTVAFGLVAMTAALVLRHLPSRPGLNGPSGPNAERAAVGAGTEPGQQAASSIELRRALAHSFDDFEAVLRLNDRLLAGRDPVAVAARDRQTLNN